MRPPPPAWTSPRRTAGARPSAPDHQGVVARLRDDPERPAELGERELGSYPFDDDALVVVLDGITDPQNFGAAARSAEAAGGSMLVTRIRRAADVTPAAIRASAGALLHLPHARVANIPRALDRLQGVGFTVVGLDGDASSTIFDDPCPEGRVALVVGSEGEGMSRLVRRAVRRPGVAADAGARRLAQRVRLARCRAVRLRAAFEADLRVAILE